MVLLGQDFWKSSGWHLLDKNEEEYSNEEILNHYYMYKLREKTNDDKRSDNFNNICENYKKWYSNEYKGNMISEKKFRKFFVNKGYKYNSKQKRLIGLKLK